MKEKVRYKTGATLPERAPIQQGTYQENGRIVVFEGQGRSIHFSRICFYDANTIGRMDHKEFFIPKEDRVDTGRGPDLHYLLTKYQVQLEDLFWIDLSEVLGAAHFKEQIKAAYNARFVEMFNKDAAGWWTYTRGGNFTFHTAHRTILRGAVERDKEGKERVRFVYECPSVYAAISKYPINPDSKQLRWGRRGELPKSDRPSLQELRAEFENWWVDVEGGMLL